jgi:phage shock protein E
MIGFIKKLFGPGTDFASLVKNGAVIVDVRSEGEYRSGHIKGSVNIPVEQIAAHAEKLKKQNKVIITCCKSGMRSGMASSTLKAKGLEVYNGGPWNVLNHKIS